MPDEIGLFEAIYSQRAIREFKSDPVPDEVVHRLIEAATKAPSGSNRQGWKFLVIRDLELKRKIGEYYNLARNSRYGADASLGSNVPARRRAASDYMAEHLHEVPVVVLACVEHDGSTSTMSRGGSIYPAVQNFLLAARGLGLGSVITSLHKRYEQEIKTMLGIPDNVETAALLPLGYPADGVNYGPTKRAPVSQVTFYDRWGSSR